MQEPERPDTTADTMGGFNGYLQGLVSVNAKPHEQKDLLVGASCVVLSAPAPYCLIYGDYATCAWLVIVSICSYMADFAALGTVWNVVDRWVAAAFTLYLFKLCFEHVPRMTCGNMLVVTGLLLYSQSSKTFEQWRFRHSLWHLVMALDILFFLWHVYN